MDVSTRDGRWQTPCRTPARRQLRCTPGGPHRRGGPVRGRPAGGAHRSPSSLFPTKQPSRSTPASPPPVTQSTDPTAVRRCRAWRPVDAGNIVEGREPAAARPSEGASSAGRDPVVTSEATGTPPEGFPAAADRRTAALLRPVVAAGRPRGRCRRGGTHHPEEPRLRRDRRHPAGERPVRRGGGRDPLRGLRHLSPDLDGPELGAGGGGGRGGRVRGRVRWRRRRRSSPG